MKFFCFCMPKKAKKNVSLPLKSFSKEPSNPLSFEEIFHTTNLTKSPPKSESTTLNFVSNQDDRIEIRLQDQYFQSDDTIIDDDSTFDHLEIEEDWDYQLHRIKQKSHELKRSVSEFDIRLCGYGRICHRNPLNLEMRDEHVDAIDANTSLARENLEQSLGHYNATWFIPERFISTTKLWGKGNVNRRNVPGYIYRDGGFGPGYYPVLFTDGDALSIEEQQLKDELKEKAVSSMTDLEELLDRSMYRTPKLFLMTDSDDDQESKKPSFFLNNKTNVKQLKKVAFGAKEKTMQHQDNEQEEKSKSFNTAETALIVSKDGNEQLNETNMNSMKQNDDSLESKSVDSHSDASSQQSDNQENGQNKTNIGANTKMTKRHGSDASTQEAVATHLVALVREFRKLPKLVSLSQSQGSMFLRYDEEKPHLMRACLTGVSGTPYAHGVFIFDIKCPTNYPNCPPKVVHVTPGAKQVQAPHGPGGFSPNLHRNSGSVCLSLLGTWDGPGWSAGSSNIYQILSSIVYMILGAQNPYSMEPGFGGWEGKQKPPCENEVKYNFSVRAATVKYAILEVMRHPPKGFEDVIRNHFKLCRSEILFQVKQWVNEAAERGLATIFQDLVKSHIELRAEFAKLFLGVEKILPIYYHRNRLCKKEVCKLLAHGQVELLEQLGSQDTKQKQRADMIAKLIQINKALDNLKTI